MKSIRCPCCRSRRRSSVLSFVVALVSLRSSCAVTGHESDRFSSSQVTQHGNDLSLSGLRRRPERDDNQHADRYNLRIHRSFIDRDPIYFQEDDQEGASLSYYGDDGYLMDQIDPFSSRTDQWQSPLERLAPLPSLSSESNPLSSAAIATTPPLTIRPGLHHPHEIDVATRLASRDRDDPPLKLKTRSTGTTIVALVALNSTALILAADTRATDGTTVADKRCEKLHVLARNAWCAGAGTSADVDALVRKVKFAFWRRGALSSSTTGGYGGVGNGANDVKWDMDAVGMADEDREVPTASVPAVFHCLRTQLQRAGGNLGANLLAGGYDHDSRRALLAAIHPHGSMDVVTHAALGSGGLAATGVLESRYPAIGRGGCSVEEGVRLAVDAVRAGVDNDLGSGSQIDVCVIRREGVLYRRAVVREEELEWVNMNGEDREDVVEIDEIPAEEKDLVVGGVNGFGNVPFAIHSKKVVSGGQLNADREQRRWLTGLLGNIQDDNLDE